VPSAPDPGKAKVILDSNQYFQIWMFAGSLPKYGRFFLLSASVILPSFMKIGW